MKAARNVNRRIGPEHDAARVDQVEIGAGDVGLDPAVDRGRIAAGHPANDVTDRRGAAESRAFARRQAEASEAVEKVAADLLAEVRADRVVGPDQGLRRRETPIDRDALGCGVLRQ